MLVGTFTVEVAALDSLVKKCPSEKIMPELGLLWHAGACKALWPEQTRIREVILPCMPKPRARLAYLKSRAAGQCGRDAVRGEVGGGQRPWRPWPARVSRCSWWRTGCWVYFKDIGLDEVQNELDGHLSRSGDMSWTLEVTQEVWAWRLVRELERSERIIMFLQTVLAELAELEGKGQMKDIHRVLIWTTREMVFSWAVGCGRRNTLGNGNVIKSLELCVLIWFGVLDI